MADLVMKATCVHKYLTTDGNYILQAMLNNDIEVMADGLQDVASMQVLCKAVFSMLLRCSIIMSRVSYMCINEY